MSRAEPWIVRLYRYLVCRLLPSGFQARHGAEMGDTFAALYEQGRSRRGLRGAARAAIRELRDLMRLVAQERYLPSPRLWMTDLGGDLKIACRQIRRAPMLSLVVVSLFAVGAGASATLFGAVDALLLRPLPLPDADRIVAGLALHRGKPFTASGRDVLAWSGARSFETSGAAMLRSYAHSHPGEAHRLEAAHVTPGYLDALGVEPVLGRHPRPREHDVALISHHLWERDFGRSGAVIGRTLELGGKAYGIVGVAPPRFDLPLGNKDVWIPLPTSSLEARPEGHRFFFVARLADGVDIADARKEIAGIGDRLRADFPDFREGWTADVIPLRTHLLRDVEGRVKIGLVGLTVAVAALLLIAGANAANLTLVRMLQRRDELRMRAALGAGRARLARQVVVESLTLAVLGALPAALLATTTLPLLARIAPVDSLAFDGALLDLRLGATGVLVCLLVALASGLSSGLLAAAHLARQRRTAVDPPTEPAGRDRRRLSGLVLAEVTLATLLLVAAGMALHGLANLRSLDMGFRPDGLLTAHLELPVPRYATPESRHGLARRLVRELREAPGIVHAGLTTDIPLASFSWSSGWRTSLGGEVLVAADRAVTPGYLETLGVRLVAGRLLHDSPADPAAGRPVVVTTDLAERLWPGRDPLGRRLFRHDEDVGRTVVGVIAPVRDDPQHFRREGAVAYSRYDDATFERIPKLVVRHGGDAAAAAAAVRATVAAVDPTIPVFDVGPLHDQMNERTAIDRFVALVGAALAGAGLLVAALGVHGVLAWLVTTRRREIGIRMALGADRGRLLRAATLPALGLTTAGMAAGLAAAWWLGGLIAAHLYHVPAVDLTAMGTTAAILLGVALLVGWRAGERAIEVEPRAALAPD